MREPTPDWHRSIQCELKRPHARSTKGTYTRILLVNIQTFAKLAQHRLRPLDSDKIVAVNKKREQGSRESPFVRLPFLKHGAFYSKWTGHVDEDGNLERNFSQQKS